MLKIDLFLAKKKQKTEDKLEFNQFMRQAADNFLSYNLHFEFQNSFFFQNYDWVFTYTDCAPHNANCFNTLGGLVISFCFVFFKSVFIIFFDAARPHNL